MQSNLLSEHAKPDIRTEKCCLFCVPYPLCASRVYFYSSFYLRDPVKGHRLSLTFLRFFVRYK